jgi:acetyl esterase
MSAPTNDKVGVTRDVIYQSDADDDTQRALAVDVYEPTRNRGAIILLHGGGWFHGDKAKDEDLASRLAQHGYLVFVPNYRLAPRYPFPAAQTDTLAAANWALASSYSFDRSKLAFWGTSAGGNLAVEAALLTGRPAVSWSGPLDLQRFIEATDGTATADAPTDDFANMSSATINQGGRNDAFLRWVILTNVAGDRYLLPEASTVKRATETSGPVYMANSIGEFVHPSDAVAMQQALTEVGVESAVHLIPGTAHAKGYMDTAFDGSITFLGRVLNA